VVIIEGGYEVRLERVLNLIGQGDDLILGVGEFVDVFDQMDALCQR